MRALLLEVPHEMIRERRRLDVDKFDEMWEGELHMPPMPSWEHQGISDKLSTFFQLHWDDLGEGVSRSNVGVTPPGTPLVDVAGERLPHSYRGPDLAFLLPGHEDRVQGGWVVGPPDSLVEIRSPGDETYKKFPFYHSLGVPEVIVIHRDTKAVELYVRGADEYERVAPAPDGSVRSAVLDAVFRTVAGASGSPPVLIVRRGRHPERERRA